MSDHGDSKKEKLRKKRMKSFLFFGTVKRMLDEVDIGTPSTSKKKPETPRKSGHRKLDNEECAEKLATVYKSLELRKREAKDRWNRFAGTEGGGGRGR